MEHQARSSKQYPNDEIDLFELIAALWHRKWVIVAVSAVFIVLSSFYLVITPKIFEAEVLISEAQSVNLAQLNVGKEQLDSYAQSVLPKTVYSLYQKKLRSRRLAMSYFTENIEPIYRQNGSISSANNLLESVFLNSFSVTGSDDDSLYLTAKFKYTDPVLAAEWLNGYLRFVEEETKEELVNSALHNKSQAVSEYEQQIVSLRTIYKRKLQDQIIRLTEAYGIAKQLNIKAPLISRITVKMPSSELDESLLYMRGYDVLGAEIKMLRSREIIDPFIPEIRPIQEKINYLDSVKYDITNLEVINVDAWANVPERSIKPRKAQVLVIAGLLGGAFGGLFAFILWFLARRSQG